MKQENPYDVLKVDITSNDDAIKTAFTFQLKSSPNKAIEIGHARLELLDPERRLLWDVQMLDKSRWLAQLDGTRQRIASFDYFAKFKH